MHNPNMSRLVKSRIGNEGLIGKRRDQFVGAAISLFSKFGFYSTTVKQIADEARISPGTIYQYVTDKEDILFLAIQQIVHTNMRVIPAALRDVSDPIHRLIVAFDVYCRVFDRKRDAVLLTYRESKSLQPNHKAVIKQMEIDTNELIASCVRDCVSHGFFRAINVDLFIYQVIMVAHTWALKHWRMREITTIDDYIAANIDILLHAVLTDQGWPHYRSYQPVPTRDFEEPPASERGTAKAPRTGRASVARQPKIATATPEDAQQSDDQ